MAQRRWCKFLFWNFIGLPCNPSYSALFLHLIFLLHYFSFLANAIHPSNSLDPPGLDPGSNPLQYSCWEIPWAEEPGRLQSMGSLRVRHDWASSLSLFTFMHWRRQWQSTPVFLPGESQGWESLVGCHLCGHTESDMTEATSQQQQQMGPDAMTLVFWMLSFKPTFSLSSLLSSRGFFVPLHFLP